ncbi:MAG: hypothetical protein C4576_14910 [Desulfobacteraceae bacterium]|nr:MAG: hypothetical protein C4576_14910 [Desulfobacteraceae bacterium]
MNEVLETSEWVSRRSLHVQIDEEALSQFAEDLIRYDPTIPPWDDKVHFFDGGTRSVAYLLVLDTLNFCFWPLPETPRWEVTIDSETFSGYYGLAASLKKALLSGMPVWDAGYLVSLTMNGLEEILGGRGRLQLMHDRLQNLQELGRVLCERFGGEPCRLVEASGGSALELARLLARNLASFRDEASYHGKKIFFYKRAQILAADLFGAFEGRGWGRFSDMEELTAFADYKLPQVLRRLGVFRYSPELARKIDSMTLIPAGSPEEVEIRANTVWAVELIRQELSRAGKERRAYEIDWILWNLGQDDTFREKPYHRTVTIYY